MKTIFIGIIFLFSSSFAFAQNGVTSNLLKDIGAFFIKAASVEDLIDCYDVYIDSRNHDSLILVLDSTLTMTDILRLSKFSKRELSNIQGLMLGMDESPFNVNPINKLLILDTLYFFGNYNNYDKKDIEIQVIREIEDGVNLDSVIKLIGYRTKGDFLELVFSLNQSKLRLKMKVRLNSLNGNNIEFRTTIVTQHLLRIGRMVH